MILIRCYKFRLPDGRTLDILAEVVSEISQWLQNVQGEPESGGYLLGYQHRQTGNITIELLTTPQPKDIRTIISCKLLDIAHYLFLNKMKASHSYYMGVWHTHPQKNPIPSSTDWTDWYATLNANKTGCGYIFFLIAGTDSFEIWVGDNKSKRITKMDECNMENGLYIQDK